MVLQTFFSVCLSAHSFGGIQTISLHDFRFFQFTYAIEKYCLILNTPLSLKFIIIARWCINLDLSSEHAFSISNPYEYI